MHKAATIDMVGRQGINGCSFGAIERVNQAVLKHMEKSLGRNSRIKHTGGCHTLGWRSLLLKKRHHGSPSHRECVL